MMIDYIADVHDKAFLFTTASAQNVKDFELRAEIDRHNYGHKKLLLRKDIKAMNRGCIRKIEVTYNAEEFITQDMWDGSGRYLGKPMAKYFKRRGLAVGDENPNYDTYHPHNHSIFAVDNHYFTSKQYLSQEKFLSNWRSVMEDETITQFHVQRLKMVTGEKRNEVHEIAKYAAKAEDYTHSQDVFDVFYYALKGRRLLTFNGLFKEAAQMFKEWQKAKKKKLPHEMDKYAPIDTTEYFFMVMANWMGDEYAENARRELTPEEHKRLRGYLVFDDENDAVD
jgi:hypothetical protein